jgi:hypothetical protein
MVVAENDVGTAIADSASRFTDAGGGIDAGNTDLAKDGAHRLAHGHGVVDNQGS